MRTTDAGRGGRRQRGAAAVEFAFVFPFLFMLTYGMIVYAYVFVVHESMNFAAQQAAEAAVAVDPDRGLADYQAAVETRIRRMAQAVLAWMPREQQDRLIGADGQNVRIAFTEVDGHNAVEVTLTLPLTEPQLLPIVTFPLVGPIPRLPDTIVARATVLL
ncbi:MAG: pilus assembly protein [Gammaproteobacteria bacterium]|nr:pilus assembly protein [Gammaproteobacteria bacterium]